MHYFCLLLSSGLHQSVTDESVDSNSSKDSLYGFLVKDIIQGTTKGNMQKCCYFQLNFVVSYDVFAEVKRAWKLRCSFCFQRGASIGCVVHKCKVAY